MSKHRPRVPKTAAPSKRDREHIEHAIREAINRNGDALIRLIRQAEAKANNPDKP